MVTPETAPRRDQGAHVLFETIEGPIRFALLDHAMQTGLFDLCAAPVGASDLALAQGLDPDRLTLVLRALVACGFLDRAGETFQTPPDLLPLLSARSPTSLIPSLQALARLRHAGLDRIAELLAPERPSPERPLFDAAYWNRAHESLASFHRGAAAEVMLPCLTGLPEWESAQSLLEIGPGSGTLALSPLKGVIGDALFAVLCGCGHNIRKILAWLRAILAHLIALVTAVIRGDDGRDQITAVA